MGLSYEDKKQILARVDHTILQPAAGWEDVRKVCDEAARWGCASVCIPPSYVERVRKYAPDSLAVCTVIGFPNGYSSSETKAFETHEAIMKGADEVDVVINIGDVKDGRYDDVSRELDCVRAASASKVMKVIIECCLLDDAEKVRLCDIVSASGADFIKTSTGFSKGGARIEDVRLLHEHVKPGVLVKAAGGIATFEDASAMIAAGASRLGTSRLVRLMDED
jgi:deoxyribose-phosphate aldolase